MNNKERITALERDKAELQAALLALLLYHQGNKEPGFVEVSNRAFLALETTGVSARRVRGSTGLL